MKYFGEPSWNFQVVRFLNGNAEDIIPRKDLVWTVSELAARMVITLEKTGRPVPQYLRLIAAENDLEKLDEAVFSMACFWTGEYKLGKVEGVVRTEAGWYEGREVTKVTFHNELITLEELVAKAAAEKCANRVYLRSDQKVSGTTLPQFSFVPDAYKAAKSDDQKKQLVNWPEISHLKYVSPMQKMILNSWAPDDRDQALRALSPRQLRVLSE